MKQIEITKDIAYAAATDEGDRSMRKAGRKTWSEEDLQIAAEMFARLWSEELS